MIRKFNMWYENIKEPYRLIVALLLVMPFITLLSTENLLLIISGILYILILLYFRISWSLRNEKTNH